MKRHFKLFTPPIITRAIYSLKGHKNFGDDRTDSLKACISPNLFDNEPNFFEFEIKKCSVYGEYGAGSSTSFALKYSSAFVITVDTDTHWLQQATKDFGDSQRIQAKTVDVGAVAAWGVPLGAARVEKFIEYTDWLWNQSKFPDLVLIDGRFRVCCFLTTIKNCETGCRIIFDDYIHRPQYHFVERFLPVSDVRGRQALFVVPEKKSWDDAQLDFAIEAFRYNLN